MYAFHAGSGGGCDRVDGQHTETDRARRQQATVMQVTHQGPQRLVKVTTSDEVARRRQPSPHENAADHNDHKNRWDRNLGPGAMRRTINETAHY